MTFKQLILASALALSASPGAAPAGEQAKAGKQTYLIVSPHTAEQCLAALDHLVAARTLETFEFGCKHGHHTGYAHVQARSTDEALAVVPEIERPDAKAIPVSRFTAAQVQALHGK
ncbi:MAG TPA: hypothetical protein VEB43_17290 [Anaeromyxobacter sp.]|nr:hypothetical protein [Anaeromyxobacter sp.]